MRLILINYEYPPLGGGAANATQKLAESFAAIGHDVLIMTSGYRGLPRIEEQNRITIYRLPTVRRALDRSSLFEMASFVAVAGVLGPRLAKRFRANLAIAFFGIPGGPVAWLTRSVIDLPYVVSLRGGDVPGTDHSRNMKLFYKLTAPILRAVWQSAGGVVANSEGLRETALRFCADHDITVIPNGVDLTTFFPRENSSSDDGPFLISAGRFRDQKGFDILLEALARLPDNRRPKLRLIGDGPRKPRLVDQASRLGISDDVEFLGWLAHDQVAESMRQADIFALASRYEGMSNVLLEAMASGLAVIATNVQGSSEIIEHGINGLLLPPEDSSALAAAIDRLVDDPVCRANLSVNARKTVGEKFCWAESADRYLALAEQILGGVSHNP